MASLKEKRIETNSKLAPLKGIPSNLLKPAHVLSQTAIPKNIESSPTNSIPDPAPNSVVRNVPDVKSTPKTQSLKDTSFLSLSKDELIKKALEVTSRLNVISQEIKLKFVERDEIIESMIVSLIAGHHVLLLGPPGTAKSLLASEFTKRISNAKLFSHLLNRTSDPSELLGPISIKGMENDEFIRVLKNKIGECEICFLDEIYKSNEPTLNALLPILNEKVIYNNGIPVKVPLKMMICASNELPPDGEGLEALHDRILIKHWVEYVKDVGNRQLMMQNYNASKNPFVTADNDFTTITIQDLDLVQYAVNVVEVPTNVIIALGKVLMVVDAHKIQVSDRKINWCLDIIKANALLNGRSIANTEDMLILCDALWERREDIQFLQDTILKLIDPHSEKINSWQRSAIEILKEAEEAYEDNARNGIDKVIEAKENINVIVTKMNKVITEVGKTSPKANKMIETRDSITDRLNLLVSRALNIQKAVDDLIDDDLPF